MTSTANGMNTLHDDIAAMAEETPPPPFPPGSIGMTMFDLPGSEDGTLTVLLGQENVQAIPAQALVRIVSVKDGRNYLGVVSAGPFALPDSLKPDSPILLTVATRGSRYLPPYHGRVDVTILGEELKDGSLAPPRLRPLPHSPVYRLSEAESAAVLKAEGDLRLGLAIGHEHLPVCVPSTLKAVLPRHTAILGTTGAGKSTTVAGLILQAQRAGMAVIVLDVEGEYTFLHEPTTDGTMQARLAELEQTPRGLSADRMTLYHLTCRETTNPAHPRRQDFSLQFAMLSPYAAMELLGLSDAQTDRFLFAYEIAKGVMRELGLFPQRDQPPEQQEQQERLLGNLDEFERGYPRLTLSLFLDVVAMCKAAVTKTAFTPFTPQLRDPAGQQALKSRLNNKEMPGNAASWGKLHSLLWRMAKLKVFHGPTVRARPLDYKAMLQPGQVSVIDLSDAGLSELSNIAVSDVLRGLQEAQDKAYRAFERTGGTSPPRVLLIIEEAHEFLSTERIEKSPVLFAQLARLAKRGRKRWLGLCFVTQLPQHLPRQVLGLINSFILHKISDPTVISSLQKTIAGIDTGLWSRLPGLAPGQAVVSFPHLTRPLLVAMDPAAAKLRMVD